MGAPSKQQCFGWKERMSSFNATTAECSKFLWSTFHLKAKLRLKRSAIKLLARLPMIDAPNKPLHGGTAFGRNEIEFCEMIDIKNQHAPTPPSCCVDISGPSERPRHKTRRFSPNRRFQPIAFCRWRRLFWGRRHLGDGTVHYTLHGGIRSAKPPDWQSALLPVSRGVRG